MVMEEIMNQKNVKLNLSSPQQSKSNKKFFGSSLKNTVGGPLSQLVNVRLKMSNTLDRPIEEVDDEFEVDKMVSQADIKVCGLDTRNSKILDENITPKNFDKPNYANFNLAQNAIGNENEVLGTSSEVVILKN